jgi:hypothetical protein
MQSRHGCIALIEQRGKQTYGVTECSYCGELVARADELARRVWQKHNDRYPEAESSDDRLLLLIESAYEEMNS